MTRPSGFFFFPIESKIAMKILFVNHTFPPESYAGSELCVLNLAKEFRRRGHETAVFYRFTDPAQEEFAVRESQYHEISVYKINHTYRYASTFQDIYVNSAIAAKFAYLLRNVQPHVVHFHHLTNLSLSLVHEARVFGCATVFTLHDYWLLCQRGQLLKRDLTLCSGPGDDACRSCLALQLLRGKTQRFVSRLLQSNRTRSNNSSTVCDLLIKKPAAIHTPQSEFVARTSFALGEEPNETLLAHPPAAIHYLIAITRPAVLKTAIAMHPSTYSCEGAGVRFEIVQNGTILFSKTINPKKHTHHRGWHSVEVDITPTEKTEDQLILRTSSDWDGNNLYCAAGWKHPLIAYRDPLTENTNRIHPRRNEIRRYFFLAAEILADTASAFSSQAKEGILHRKNWVKRIFDETDLFVSPSKFLRDFFIRRGLPAHKILFSDNGFLPPPRWKAKTPQYPIRFGYMGTWIPSKGVDVALQAFQSIDPAYARFIVHGFFPGYDGYEDYEVYLRALSGPAVEWRGKYEPDDVYTLLAELDCLIMPSIWWENSPLTIHEAFQAGVPVITADVGGMAEFVCEGGGLTFRHRDPLSLRAVIQRILQNPEILEDLQFSIPHVKSVAQHADELLEIYTQLQEEKTERDHR
ncbi:MAG: glycosyltransferase [Candidatus Omnitrophota bacterium]|jgi:glycosyltransferase involved in cell wall biosynthesis|nr:MAG: glycosyltransferase [Candidatus Omnitrophota bacterium]